jgi:hypothetical protein
LGVGAAAQSGFATAMAQIVPTIHAKFQHREIAGLERHSLNSARAAVKKYAP